MIILNFLKLATIFFLVDSLYLFSMKDKFNTLIKGIQGSSLKLKTIPTILCYIFLVSSIYYFIIQKNATILDAFFLGFFMYGVYETTNLAIFDNWTPFIALIDTIWGGILFMTSVYIFNYFKH